MAKVNAKELARMFVADSGRDITIKQAEKDIRQLSALITKVVVNGDEVRLPEFGIVPTERAAKDVVNPRTGEKMTVPAHRSALLKRYKPMQDALNPPKPKKSKTKAADKKTKKSGKGKKSK